MRFKLPILREDDSAFKIRYELIMSTNSDQNPIHNGSFWFDSLDGLQCEEPGPLPTDVDIAIVGAGFTGMWTAYYLNRSNPNLDIAVFESNTVGFGASGRNGGWCMGWSQDLADRLLDPNTQSDGMAIARAMEDTVDEIGRVCQAENIDCHFAKGGTLTIATRPFDVEEYKAGIEHYYRLGFTEDDFIWLDEDDSRQRLNMTPNHGAVYTPHCASIHPARLVRGLGEVLRSKGIKIYEQTPVTEITPNKLVTLLGEVKAGKILRATEGYTDSIKGQERKLIPLYSMMVATEPLPDTIWDEIGLRKRETFGDERRQVIYGQRTMDNRLAFGGRGGYYFGSKRKAVIPTDDPDLDKVEAILRGLFPMLDGYKVTNRWGGLMGVNRHWKPCVSFDKTTGIGAAGGYTGEGVGASNLAARMLADLVLGNDSDITHLAWVNDNAGKWEPEPFRWSGSQLLGWLAEAADNAEMKSGKPSRLWGSIYKKLSHRLI